jgi:hypothetical protein
MKQGLKGTHIATGQSVEIELTDKEMKYATCKDSCVNECWQLMNDLVTKRTGEVIIGQVEIDVITINHLDRPFH